MSDFSLLAALWLSAFTSATLLPGTSEAAFAAVLWQRPEAAWSAWLAAGSGNTLGSLTSYWLGRLLPERAGKLSPRAVRLLRRHGAWLLLLAWLPLLGDALPLAAGWLRLNAWACAAALAAGKFARYALIWQAAGWLL
ncbi:DedA family protein [Eikenella sp. S3360]|uniref:DedA family protein n=1 Tax=Eikenella glucosivorans TaxID=2766967 RepID=A0ABS0NC33_9NEIS|nr:VTT domain-containing protein [Eikenella glucosivorans]MBH5329879.1 DedA family protein [Eikenella glucosivorans]